MTELQIKRILVEKFIKLNREIIIGAEVPFQYGERRADLITLDGYIATSYEIKSAGDNTSRLSYQLDSYKSFFDFCFIVCEIVHLDAIRKLAPTSFGIIVVNENEIQFVRKSKQFKMHNKETLASYLPVNTLRKLTRGKNIKSKHELCSFISKNYSKDFIYRLSREALHDRYSINSALLRSDSNGLVTDDDIFTITKRPPEKLIKID
ncbi:sce7726 family protein [Aeromonas veronii]|uniref:sce7726 family protein n=1 Tax=Aeromonas veronii TaxID=654 RepID=UPI0038D265BC